MERQRASAGSLYRVPIRKGQHPGQFVRGASWIRQYCDLWAITLDGKQVFQLTDLPNAKGNGC
jgi:hypothetical protein